MGSRGLVVAVICGALVLGGLALPIADAERLRRATDGGLVAVANAVDRNPTASGWRRLAERYQDHATGASPAGLRLYEREAVRAYREAARLAPAHARTWLHLADLALRRGDDAREAAALLAQSSRTAPRRPAYVRWRAHRAIEVWASAADPDRRVLARQIARAWRTDRDALRTHAETDDLVDALRDAVVLAGTGGR